MRSPAFRQPTLLLAALLTATTGCRRDPPPVALPAPAARPVEEPPPAPLPRPPVIDVHAHIAPPNIPLAVQFRRDLGLKLLVNLSGGNRSNGGLDLWWGMEREVGGTFVHCWNPPWRELFKEDGPRRLVHGLMDTIGMGYRCVKISKALGLGIPTKPGSKQLMAVDDERLDPMWAKAGELGVPVLIHTGDPKAFFEPPTPDNERYEELAAHPGWSFADRARYPTREALLAARERIVARHAGTSFIGVHFGNNPEDPADVERLLDAYPNFHVDIAARLGEIGRHPAATMRRLFIKHQDRILFGTDISIGRTITLGSGGDREPSYGDIRPFYEAHFRYLESDEASMPNPVPIQGRWDIHPLGLPRAVLEKIYWRNAVRLIPGLWSPTEAKPEPAPRSTPP